MSEVVVFDETIDYEADRAISKGRHPAGGRGMTYFDPLGPPGQPEFITEDGVSQGHANMIGGAEIIEFPARHVGAAVVSLTELDEAPAAERYNPAVDEVRPKYPNMAFTFNPNWVVGTAVVEASPDSRLRAVVKGLEGQGIVYTVPDITTHYRKLHALLTQNAKILAPDEVLDEAFDKLVRTNHPVAQALRQLEADFPALKRNAIRDVRDKLLAMTSSDDIKARFRQAKK